MGLIENFKHEFYQVLKASEHRISANGEKIDQGETYLRFYRPAKEGEKVSLHIISRNLDLTLIGFYKLPSDKYNTENKILALQCEWCKVYFLGVHERFCCAAHGESNFEAEAESSYIDDTEDY
jgi:hypothetical protein